MSCSTVSQSWEMLPIKNLIKVDRNRRDIRQVGSEAATTTNMSYLRLALETPEENLYQRGDKQAEAAGYYSDMMRLPPSWSVWNLIWCRTKSLIKMGVNNQNKEHEACLPPQSIIFLCPPWCSAWVLSPNRLTSDGRLVRLFVSPPLPLKGFPSSIRPSDCLLFAWSRRATRTADTIGGGKKEWKAWIGVDTLYLLRSFDLNHTDFVGGQAGRGEGASGGPRQTTEAW